MKLRSRGFLGLAIGSRSIACAELTGNGERGRIRQAADFVFPEECSLDTPEATGLALAAFLREHQLRSTHVVVGVPARWLLAVERDVPALQAGQAHSILRMHAERLSSAENGDMTFDYAGPLAIGRQAKVLLVGILHRQLEQVRTLAKSAGLSIAAVTSTALAVAGEMEDATNQPVLILGRDAAEWVGRNGGTVSGLRHVASVSPDKQGLPVLGPAIAELRRAVALAPMNDAAGTREFVLWNGLGLSEPQVSEFAGRLGVAVRAVAACPSPMVGHEAGLDSAQPTGQIASALLLSQAASHGRLPLDFEHSRLAPPRKRMVGRRMTWGIAVAAAVALAMLSLYWNVRQREADLRAMQARLDSTAPDIKLAEQMLDRVAYASGFLDARLSMLECMREITLAFRDDEPIWITGLTLKDNGKGQLIGKAANQKVILLLCDRMQGSPSLQEVRTLQMVEINAPGGKSKEQSFTIGFTFVGTE
jgi:hypothetical protein